MRCFQPFRLIIPFVQLSAFVFALSPDATCAPLSLAPGQMLVDDVVRIFLIYFIVLVGFSLAFHVILYADSSRAIDELLSRPAGCSGSIWNFKTVRKSLLSTAMMT